MKLQLSKYRSGKGGVVEQDIIGGKWGGSVWVYRCRKNRYYSEIPQVLNVPFDSEELASKFGLELFNGGYRVSIRRGKRSGGKWEVQVFFPMGFSVKNAVETLENSRVCNGCKYDELVGCKGCDVMFKDCK